MAKITLCESCGWACCSRGLTEGRHEAVTVVLAPNTGIDAARLPSARLFRWNDGAVAATGVTQEVLSAAVVAYDPAARDIARR